MLQEHFLTGMPPTNDRLALDPPITHTISGPKNNQVREVHCENSGGKNCNSPAHLKPCNLHATVAKY